MSESVQKKIKIFNLAKDLNLSSETIIEFLRKKGFDVKGHMSTVDEDMLSLIMGHFKKEKEVAERHQRKLQEFRSTRKEKTDKADKKNAAKEEEKFAAEEELVEVIETQAPIVPEEPIVEPEDAEEPGVVKEIIPEHVDVVVPSVEPPPPILKPEPPKAIVEKPNEEKQPAALPVRSREQHKKKNQQTPLEALIAHPQRGLTIKGKMDLTSAAATGQSTAEADKKRKKKKKKIDATVHPKQAVPSSAEEVEVDKSRKRKRVRRAEVDEDEVARAIRETLSDTEGDVAVTRAAIRRKKKEKREEEQQRILDQQELDKTRIKATEFVTVGELANLMRVPVADVIQKVMGLGMMVSINQRLEKDTITLVADEFGFQVDFESEFAKDILTDQVDDEASLKPRPPVVTIMGHVDHGKTSLLDYVRNANVVAGEAGGITQHIGAYKVTVNGSKQITFLDTPGHEAFTAMRARGAQITDIVVLVVAADDSVMPQTIEAISHAQAASVPILVAINKIDKPEANPERIKQQLAEHNVLIEDYGGKAQAVELSAKKGTNVNLLLEKILLEAEMLNLRANPDRLARGTIVEAELDKGRGITATVLVPKGNIESWRFIREWRLEWTCACNV